MKKIFTTLFCITLSAWAVPGLSMTIVADPSDREVFGSGGVGTGPGDVNLEDFGVGDTTDPGNPGRRGLLKFPLSGLPGTIQNATLKLTIIQSRKDQSPATGGTIDDVPPFTNPGLGPTRVIHIADPGAFGAVSYGAPSIGNDPGVLIPAGSEPGSVVSINVKKAVQQALRAGSPFVTFRIQTNTETDRDGLNDVWFFASADNSDPATRPIIEVNSPRSLWLNHFDLLAGAADITTSFNSTSSGVGGGLTGLVIQSATTGETFPDGGNKVVHRAAEAPDGETIIGVRVCYELSNARSFISQMRLAQVQDPPDTALVLLDDGTDLTDQGPVCVNSEPAEIDSSAGPVLLSLRLNFGDPSDKIVIRGLGLLLQAKSEDD